MSLVFNFIQDGAGNRCLEIMLNVIDCPFRKTFDSIPPHCGPHCPDFKMLGFDPRSWIMDVQLECMGLTIIQVVLEDESREDLQRIQKFYRREAEKVSN